MGFWRGITYCGAGPEEGGFSITKSSTTANRIIIGGGIYGELIASNGFDIPTQTGYVNGTAATINGWGDLYLNELKLNYVVRIQGETIRCTGTYNKQ